MFFYNDYLIPSFLSSASVTDSLELFAFGEVKHESVKQNKGREIVTSSLVTQRGGALRDETKKGCEGDYVTSRVPIGSFSNDDGAGKKNVTCK